MTLAAVDRLSAALADRYRIERELGQGGMATVYLAEDLKHKRKVALKVLKPELAAVLGAERFVQEITTTASLQHPHILPLFDSGTADGFLYYVMPFIEGETLRDKLNRETQLGVDEAVKIAIDVADALHYAHSQGVIHRDIKPENILIQNGRPMVADFGIALAVSAAAGGRMTETGLSLGTPHYMSPEQATAEKEISARSDVYSLASVLYEALAGQPPHVGGSAQQIIMKIIAEPVQPVTALRKSVSPNVAAALTKALEKLPADRFSTAKEFGDALGNAAFTASGTHATRTVPAGPDWRQQWAVTLIAALAVALPLAAWGWLRAPATGNIARHLVIDVPRLARTSFPLLSPTGERIVFSGDGRLWIRDLDDRVARPLSGTDGALAPFWSPDGRNIAYFAGNRVFRIPAGGGAPALVTTIEFACPLESACGGSWTDEGTILVSSGFADVQVVPERGGQARTFVPADSTEHFHRLAALPGGGAVIEVDPDHGVSRLDHWDGTTRRPLLEGQNPRYAGAGYILFTRGSRVWAVRLHGSALAGDAFPVADGARNPSASADGTLLYQTQGTYDEQLIWVDSAGTMREAIGSDDGVAQFPALSPDESRIAFNGKAGIRVHSPARGIRMALGGSDRVQRSPVWSATGDQVYYESASGAASDQEDALIRVARPGSGAPVTVVNSGTDPAISPDGRYLTWSTGNVSDQDLWYRDLRLPSSAAVPFLDSPEFASSLRIAPNGRFAAFVAGDWATGKLEVYISRFPGGEDRIQVSAGGIMYYSRVYWSLAGDRLYYVRESDGALMATDVFLGADVRISTPRVLFTEAADGLSLGSGLAVSRNSSRFLVVRRSVKHGGEPSAFVLVENWKASGARAPAR